MRLCFPETNPRTVKPARDKSDTRGGEPRWNTPSQKSL